jgi:signal-transduction protein with cAMP-binding, CBS, and nucleotidyltransferase domain
LIGLYILNLYFQNFYLKKVFLQENVMTELPQSEHPKEKLGDFMTIPVISIDVKASVQEAAHLMDTENASAILTTENGDHVGIVTERDFT